MPNQPKLVNKQFNSPIGLYSDQNIREVISREQQILSNGAVGVNFYNPQAGKPANLQNSAVLRMLEEEETRRSGYVGNNDIIPGPLRDVAWPPADYEHTNQLRSSFKDVVTPGVKRVAWPPPQEGVLDPADVAQPAQQSPAHTQGGPQYSSPGLQQNNYSPQQSAPYQQTQQPFQRPLKPLDVSSVGTGSPLGSPSINQSPHGFRTGTPTKGWAPVHSPVAAPPAKYFGTPAQSQPQYQPGSQHYQSSQGYQQPAPQYQGPGQQYGQPGQYQQPSSPYQSPQPQYQPPQQQYQPPQQQYQPPQQPSPQYQSQSFAQPPSQSQPVAAQTQVAASRPQGKPVEPPPSTITLRPSAPVSQKPAPVYSAQPATASLRGGKHLRGDLKWPPEDVRHRMAEEDRLRIELAQGPACRPTRKDKNYEPFFAQHALNSTYPGYKIPPGTQFYRPE